MKDKHSLSYLVVGLLVLIAIWHALGVYLDWYYKFWWFDEVTHSFGGLWAACFVFWFWNFFSIQKLNLMVFNWIWSTNKSLFFAIVLSVFLIGFVWEILEVLIKATGPGVPLYWFDTIKDLCMDTLGGVAGAYLLTRR